MGLEKHYPKPRDLNKVSCKNFIELIIEFVHQKLKFERFIVVGHSFGGIIANAIAYYYPDLVAGVSFNAVSNIASHLGFWAYTGSSYGLISDLYNNDYKYIEKNINDIDFQLHFQRSAKKMVLTCSHTIFRSVSFTLTRRKLMVKPSISTMLSLMTHMKPLFHSATAELCTERVLKYFPYCFMFL